MNVQDFLDTVAYVGSMQIMNTPSRVYKSKFDDSYLTHIGLEDDVKFLAEREITEELTRGVGFSLKDGKWYGWSHRAIWGFEVGSTCKKGDCHYNRETLDAQQEDAIRFWNNEERLNTRCEGIVEEDGERYFDIKWNYSNNVPNGKLRNTISGCLHHIKPLGKGEWTAVTLEDAKLMAQDFNKGAS